MKELMGRHGDETELAPSVAGLVQPELAKQAQEIRPLQADGPGGPRAISTVGREPLE